MFEKFFYQKHKYKLLKNNRDFVDRIRQSGTPPTTSTLDTTHNTFNQGVSLHRFLAPARFFRASYLPTASAGQLFGFSPVFAASTRKRIGSKQETSCAKRSVQTDTLLLMILRTLRTKSGV